MIVNVKEGKKFRTGCGAVSNKCAPPRVAAHAQTILFPKTLSNIYFTSLKLI
jgi:hypothetical protein